MASFSPEPSRVAAMYDEFTDLFARTLGGNIHLGYWDDDSDTSPAEVATGRLTDMVAARLGLTAGQRVLDVGCGNGKPAIRIATQYQVHVTGITISRHQLDQASARAGAGPGPGQAGFLLADAMNLPFADASFDAAFAIESILHMPDKDAVFGHLARVLRPGGRLVLAEPCQDDPVSGRSAQVIGAMRERRQFSFATRPDTYRPDLQRAGLRVETFTEIGEHMRRGYHLAAAAYRQAAACLPSPAADQLIATSHLTDELADLPELGYFLLAAIRP